MKGDTPLDYAVFQLTPTRTRCELMVSAGGETEKLASGLLNPFLMHIKAVNDQIAKGGCSIKLEPPADDATEWFTKGTIERFVRFVSTPEVLERVCSVDNELSHLEESLSRNSDTYLCDEQTVVSGMSSPSSGADGSRQSEFGNLQVAAGEHESPKFQLLKALEARRCMLQKEQSMAFARAIAAGYVAENIPSLIQFADYFGASRLHDACENYMRLCAKRRDSEFWLEDDADVEAQANGAAREAQVVSLCGEGESGLPYDSSCSEKQSREAGLMSLEPESTKISCGEYVGGGGNIDEHERYTEDISGRRLSVQEKITMFESKKKTAGGIYDKRRMSTDAGRMDLEKPVLRRWSLVVDKTATSSQQEGKLKNLEATEEVEQRAEDRAGMVPDIAQDDPQAAASGDDLLLPRENKDVNKEKSSTTQASPKVNFMSASISLDNFWGQRGQYEQSGEKQVQEDQKSVMSDTQSLKETKGRLYDKYREKRDAKLREEAGPKKAEKQARLKAMQETLERRRAEVARSLRSNKADVLAEARQRAEKLRAFKAGLLEVKRAQEEEEKKRLEELRMQRLQKKPASCAPASPCSGASTPKELGVRSSMLPTFQRATSTVRTIQKKTVSQSVPSTSEFRRMSGKPRRAAQQDNSDAAVKPRASSSNKEDTQSNRLRSMVLRKSVDALRGLQKGQKAQPVSISADTLAVSNTGGLKCLSSDSDPQEGLKSPAAEAAATEADGNRVEDLKDMVIRAPVTSDEELARPIENDADEQDQVAARVVAVSAENKYKAPIAPVSISPMVEAYGA